MKKLYVPRVELEIGENLYLVIDNVDYSPGDPGKLSGPPEDCYEPTAPEVDWYEKDERLLYRENRHVFSMEKMTKVREVVEHFYPCPKNLAGHYIDAIIDACEKELGGLYEQRKY